MSFTIRNTVAAGWFSTRLVVCANVDCTIKQRTLVSGWDGNPDVRQRNARVEAGQLIELRVPKKRLPDIQTRISIEQVGEFFDQPLVWEEVTPDRLT